MLGFMEFGHHRRVIVQGESTRLKMTRSPSELILYCVCDWMKRDRGQAKRRLAMYLGYDWLRYC